MKDNDDLSNSVQQQLTTTNNLQNSEIHFSAKIRQEKKFTIMWDSITGMWYKPGISGFGMNVIHLNEDNLNFIKVLNKHNQLNVTPDKLNREAIENIVKDLDYDSDLWDDIFDNNDVFRSVFSEADIRRKKPDATTPQIHRAKMTESVNFYMKRTQLKSQFKQDTDCRKYIRSRINVFKFYIYLRRCAILYRDTSYQQPLTNLIHFLELPEPDEQKITNYAWLKDKLRVDAVGLSGENWNSGLHEWLTCSQTLEAIKRTAGLQKEAGIQACLSECVWAYRKDDNTEGEYFCSEFNWLDLQLLLRTPNKYVIFRSSVDTVENGHCGAVNTLEFPVSALEGKCTKGTQNSPSESAFHNELNTLLEQSSTINAFVIAIHNKYNVSIFHDGTRVQPVAPQNKRFLVDGTPTDDQPRLQAFQEKLVEPHRFFYHCERDVTMHERIAHESIRFSTMTDNAPKQDNNTTYRK